jgi:hypothetical protein
MPELSRFYGIIIRMFYGDQLPPRFHAIHEGEECQVNINTLEAIDGFIGRRAEALVYQWAATHRDELRQAWTMARRHQAPVKIQPLD